MRLLAIDTSERYFSVAILDSGTLVAQISSRDELSRDQRESDGSTSASHSDPGCPNGPISESMTNKKPAVGLSPGVAVQLFPMLQALFRKSALSVRQIELLAVASGPGMFTGLRSGVVAAKTLAYGLGVPLVAVNTLAAMASQAVQEIESDQGFKAERYQVFPVVNAQRQQLFAGFYEVNRNPTIVSGEARNKMLPLPSFEIRQLSADKIMDRADWLQMLKPGDWVTGTGLTPLIGSPELLQTCGIRIASQAIWPAQASTVGILAWRDYLLGRRDDMWTLEPFYFRPSYAEE